MDNRQERYSAEQVSDTEKLLDIYKKVPDEKRPLLLAVMDAFANGMQTQERLGGIAAKAS